ncbi:MAG: glycosyltransferase family 2 protein, partial [bacterium]|nr:glycosyltransferase family 2 protein [bacterium]
RGPSGPARRAKSGETVNRPLVSVVVPAFNEADVILDTLARLVEHLETLADRFRWEIVVVDDGSSDGTGRVAELAGARVVRHPVNRGKAAGMYSGMLATVSPVVCFLDADLLNITPQHLGALCDPIVNGAAKSQLATFTGGRAATTLAQRIAPYISGQRCLRRELLLDFTDWNCGFGIETALNAYLAQRGIEQVIVPWHGAAQVMKEEKRGLLRGFHSRLGMYRDIMRSWAKSRR